MELQLPPQNFLQAGRLWQGLFRPPGGDALLQLRHLAVDSVVSLLEFPGGHRPSAIKLQQGVLLFLQLTELGLEPVQALRLLLAPLDLPDALKHLG